MGPFRDGTQGMIWERQETELAEPRQEPPVSSSPCVLLSRFRDNIYIVFMNVLQELLPVVRRGVMCFLQCLYGVPLKWEPTELTVSWGECSWRVLPLGFSLTWKHTMQSSGVDTVAH